MIPRTFIRFVLLALVLATAGYAAKAQTIVACVGVGTDQTNPLVDNCGGTPGALMLVQNVTGAGQASGGHGVAQALSISLERNAGGDQLLQDLYSGTVVPTMVIVVYGPPVHGKQTPTYHFVLTNAQVLADSWGASVGTNLGATPSESLLVNFTSLEILDDANGQKAVYTAGS